MTIHDPIAVSLNGVDNIGKTTQLAWLRRALTDAHLVGTIDRWNDRWREVAAGDFAHWWFVASTTEEHVKLMLRSHAARRAGSHTLALEDRGLPMLHATCAATAVIKDRLSPQAALAKVEHIAAQLPETMPRREVHILLRRCADPEQEAAEALRREPTTPGQRYADYQHALAEILHLQAQRGDFHTVLEVSDTPILGVQQQLRQQLSELNLAATPLPDAELHRLWVLAGLSECGKSTAGELLRGEHGVTRLKIGYLLEIAAARASIHDPYQQWDEPEQAERLTEEILRFGGTHQARTISVESAHRLAATEHLKRIWGTTCQIIYLHAEITTRARRSHEAHDALRARDTTKRERGAHQIIDIADHVVDNSGPLSALKLTIARLVSLLDHYRIAAETTQPDTQAAWLERATEHLVDDQVALVLATGSTANPDWRTNWSDLDLLVARDTVSRDWLQDRVATLPASGGIKAAVSSFTTSDVANVRVPPRVLRSLQRAADGVGVLYRRPGYSFPIPRDAEVDRASRGELGLVAMTTRRLLAQRPRDVRALHKHVVLLAKILLRADGIHADATDDVLTVFAQRHPRAGCSPPPLDDLIHHPDHPVLREQLTDSAERLLTYLDRLDHTVRSPRP